MHERERPALRGLPADLADDAAVHDGGDRGVRAGGRDHGVDPGAHAQRERLHRLGARDHLPALLLDRLQRDRVALGEPHAELAAVPVAEEDLDQLGDHDRLEPEPRRQRRRGLRGPLQRRDEEAAERLAGEPLGHERRLHLALGRERGIAVAVEEREPLPRHGRLRGAMADEDDLGRARREDEPALVVDAFGDRRSLAARRPRRIEDGNLTAIVWDGLPGSANREEHR